ncbi:MAPEG family protein [Candidatus Viadribacter manganicus]|nr:MAPEG family protein [Candidatus Viadribacter manganicus]
MQAHAYVAIVTVVALLVYLWTVIVVGAARRASGIKAPAMTGDPRLERALRVQANTLEWLPMFLPGLWLCHLFWLAQDQSGVITAAIGLVWIVGRIFYGLGYMADPSKRELGFVIQFLASMALVLGALAGAVMALWVR